MVIVVAIDLHEDAAPVLDAAREMAALRKEDVLLVHAEPIPMMAEAPELGGMVLDPLFLKGQETADLKALGTWAEALRSDGLQAATRLVHGDPGHGILDVAREVDASLIVLGTHPRRGMRILLPSVAAAVVRGSSCRVLVVPLAKA